VNATDFLNELSRQHRVTSSHNLPSYSSTGFALLGLALSAVEEQSHVEPSSPRYEAMLHRDVFSKLGMSGSSFAVDDSNRMHVVVPSTNSDSVVGTDDDFHYPSNRV